MGPITIKSLLSQAGIYLRSQFEDLKRTNPHYATRGNEAEEILRTFLNEHLPKRFSAGTGYVIDSQDQISLQSDVLVYDAENSPVYRANPQLQILPSDNVAAVIEVKSNLDKAELEDAAQKIASVKKLHTSPITNIDQPVTASSLVTTKPQGIVFAYESKTSLETLTQNLKEINEKLPSNQWIDRVVVLDKGIIGYSIQFPYEEGFAGWLGGMGDDESVIPPLYVHLVKAELGEFTLNRFFFDLMSQLTFYRKRSAIQLASALGTEKGEVMTINAYQYNLARQLIGVTSDHMATSFKNPRVRYNLFGKKDHKFLGQICYWPWQDGAVIHYSGFLPPEPMFKPYATTAGVEATYIQAKKGANAWLSSLLPLSEEKFIEISEGIGGDLILECDTDDETDLPWERGPIVGKS